jgi:hypothetical protein
MRRRGAQRHAGEPSSAGQGSRCDKAQNETAPRSLDWTRRKVPVPSVSPSHAMAMVEVVKGSFRNKLDLLLRVEADPLQRE